MEPHLPTELLVRMHDLMLQTRLLEERLIRMQKQGDGYFWIGGPGEEAFTVPLGLLVHKGAGLDYDYLHLHYRCSGTILAMGGDPVDSLRQMKNTATDPYSGGRNFAGHPAIKEWNVVPVSSPIEVQYSMAPGTALAQRAARRTRDHDRARAATRERPKGISRPAWSGRAARGRSCRSSSS